MFFRQPFDRYVLTLWMTEWIDYYDDDDDELEKNSPKQRIQFATTGFFYFPGKKKVRDITLVEKKSS